MSKAVRIGVFLLATVSLIWIGFSGEIKGEIAGFITASLSLVLLYALLRWRFEDKKEFPTPKQKKSACFNSYLVFEVLALIVLLLAFLYLYFGQYLFLPDN